MRWRGEDVFERLGARFERLEVSVTVRHGERFEAVAVGELGGFERLARGVAQVIVARERLAVDDLERVVLVAKRFEDITRVVVLDGSGEVVSQERVLVACKSMGNVSGA